LGFGGSRSRRESVGSDVVETPKSPPVGAGFFVERAASSNFASQGSLNSGVMSFEELRKVFSVMDLNHVGSITHVELQELMRRFGTPITDEEAHAMVSVGDTNGDGMLDLGDIWGLLSAAPCIEPTVAEEVMVDGLQQMSLSAGEKDKLVPSIG